MMELLVLKERVKGIYQKYGHIIEPALKFILAIIVFSIINITIGYDVRLKAIPTVLVLSLLSAFTPISIMILLAAIFSMVHILFISKILAIITTAIILILYLLLLRFTPKLIYVALALPILFILKIPYVIPILLGIISTPISIIPMVCGVIIYYLFQLTRTASNVPSDSSIEDTLQFYKFVMDTLLKNKQMFLTIIVFAIIIVITYLIRRLTIDHAFDLAIVAGGLINILAFLLMDLKLDISEQILFMILGTLVSAGLVYIIQFFRLNLDYTRVERVQFEDDDYYYYVKAVPKINVTTPDVNIKRINPRKTPSNNIRLKDLIQDTNKKEAETYTRKDHID